MTTHEALVATHASDVDNAREALRHTLDQLGERWIPGDALIEALLREALALGNRYDGSPRIAERLRLIAAMLDDANTRHLHS
ncbi:MAG: hypothetical protein JJU06_15500 [Ectothiorhodospiraceae bacterium]|nr:hypothetical protein [Ectothiorhodospiraceae bacterium]